MLICNCHISVLPSTIVVNLGAKHISFFLHFPGNYDASSFLAFMTDHRRSFSSWRRLLPIDQRWRCTSSLIWEKIFWINSKSFPSKPPWSPPCRRPPRGRRGQGRHPSSRWRRWTWGRERWGRPCAGTCLDLGKIWKTRTNWSAGNLPSLWFNSCSPTRAKAKYAQTAKITTCQWNQDKIRFDS